jgi:hypothetical protein
MNHLTSEIESYLCSHYPTEGAIPVAKALGLPVRSIRRWAKRLKIKMTKEAFCLLRRDCQIREPSDYKVNPDQFATITSPDVAYLLGLLWADGHLQQFGGSGCIRLNNQTRDMRDIRPVLNRTGKWGFYEMDKRQPTWKGQTMVTTNGAILFRLLESFDYRAKNASPNKILAHIPESLRHYWWRGYFDGDGCLYLGRYCHQIVFAGPYDQDWSFATELCKVLDIRCGIGRTINKKGHKGSTLRVSGIRNCKKLCAFMYTGYETDQIGFKRKRLKYEELDAMVPKR